MSIITEPVTVKVFVKLPEPETSNLYPGVGLPIPTFPLLFKINPVDPEYCNITPSLEFKGSAFSIREVFRGPVIVLGPPPDLKLRSPSTLTAFALLLVQSPNFAPISSSNAATVLGVPEVLILSIIPTAPLESYLLSI